jgi:hypothetical protein
MRIKRRDGSIKDIESHGRPFDLSSIADDVQWIRLFHGAVEIATIGHRDERTYCARNYRPMVKLHFCTGGPYCKGDCTPTVHQEAREVTP